MPKNPAQTSTVRSDAPKDVQKQDTTQDGGAVALSHAGSAGAAGRATQTKTTQFDMMCAMLHFYFSNLRAFSHIQASCGGPDAGSGSIFSAPLVGEITFDGKFAYEINSGFEKLRALARGMKPQNYQSILTWSHCLRWIVCLVSILAPSYGVLVGAVQFVVAPLSLPIAVMKAMTYICHAMVHYMFAILVGPVLGGYAPCFTINLKFCLTCFAIDQALNFYIYLTMSEPFGWARLARHVVYGTCNTKLYFVVVFGCLQGLQVDVALVVIVSVLSFAFEKYLMQDVLRMFRLPCRDVRFYLDHRLGHLPVVYVNAHKMHHHLHDSTPWDATTYGNGMNEHYFMMVRDVFAMVFSQSCWVVPYCFNGFLLDITWSNKLHHTRCKPGSDFYDKMHNFHADHHTFHNQNFALANGALLDFYFGTQCPHSKVAALGGYLVSREEVKVEGELYGEIVIEVSKTLSRSVQKQPGDKDALGKFKSHAGSHINETSPTEDYSPNQ